MASSDSYQSVIYRLCQLERKELRRDLRQELYLELFKIYDSCHFPRKDIVIRKLYICKKRFDKRDRDKGMTYVPADIDSEQIQNKMRQFHEKNRRTGENED